MFLNFLSRRYCLVCQKLDTRANSKNEGSFTVSHDNDLIFEDHICSCSQCKGIYYKSTMLLRVIQTILLVVIFVTTISTLLVIRNSRTLNANFSEITLGYIEYKKGSYDFKAQENNEQLAILSFE